MKIVTTAVPNTENTPPAAVAMGYFDGVHLGHQAVIAAACRYAKAHGLQPAVFTFEGGPKNGAGRLCSQAQKHRLLEELGVEVCYEPPFERFGGLEPQRFFNEMLLGEYHARALFCGEDFAFGARRAGDVALLRRLCEERGVALSVVPMALYQGQAVSSSRIRTCIAKGEMPEANAMLGRPYEVQLPVQHGRQLGRTLGFPTINQRFPPWVQAPALGVYVTTALLDGKAWPAATGFTTRPTVDGGEASCETFIPGFSGNLYDEMVPVRFYQKIDEPCKFENFEALAQAVQGWAKMALEYFEKTL